MSASLEDRLPALYDSVSGHVDAPRDVYQRLQFLARMIRAVSDAGTSRPCLAWSGGAADVATLSLRGPPVVIGRGSDCDIPLKTPRASRRHCRIGTVAGAASVEDLASSNGTWVNGARINSESPLSDGDVIEVGGTPIAFLQP